MIYPVIIHKDVNSDYGVTIPDLPGCFSAGDTVNDAIENAKEAILTHIEGLLMDDDPIPVASDIDKLQKSHKEKNITWALVEVDFKKLSQKAKRVNITIPERMLSKFDRYVEKSGETRSGLLVNAMMEYMQKHDHVI